MTVIMGSFPDTYSYTVRRALWSHDQEALRRIRTRVFVQEQAVPEELEWDDKDQDAVHVLALTSAGLPIGTARLLATGQIGRMAVLPEWRGRGVGRALLGELLAIAAKAGYADVFLNAQASALPFYLGAGFVPVGDELEEAGIPHRRMILPRRSHVENG
jgi:predicted GNAT family N-acyltransferase